MRGHASQIVFLRRAFARGFIARFGLLAGLMLAAGAVAQTIYVDDNTGNDTRTGLGDWTNAVKTISNGVSKAVASSTVLVATGHYAVVSNIVITSGITLRSWNNGALDPTNTVIDGQGNVRCLYMHHASARVAGFTLTGGNGMGDLNSLYGGAVYINSLGGVLSNCFVFTNSANSVSSRGGGVFVVSANGVIVDCKIKYNEVTNTSARAGGVYIAGNGKLFNSTVAFNTNLAAAGCGGGVHIRDSSVPMNSQVVGCVISNNYSAGSGGGVYVAYACPLLTDNMIVSNQAATSGGGMYFSMVKKGAVFADNTVSGNTAATAGGGVYISPIYDGTGGILVSNCAIVNNTVSEWGGGINVSIATSAYTNTDIVVTHCVISGNRSTTVNTDPGFRGGGGVYWNAPGRLENCVVSNNWSGCAGGGLYLQRAHATYSDETYDELIMRNCLVVSNHAYNAGGVFFRSCDTNKAARLESCTVAGNIATNYAGGVCIGRPDEICNGVTLTNTIVYHNSASADINIKPNAQSGNYFIGYCNTIPTNQLNQAGALVNVITNDPVFAGWESGNFRLHAGSPCINAGLLQEFMLGTSDLDGHSRIDRLSGKVDMGAYEYQLSGFMMMVH